MPSHPSFAFDRDVVAFADTVITTLRKISSEMELRQFMAALTTEMGFTYYALIHHDDLREARDDRVDLKDYPATIVDRLVGEGRYRRDPVIRACLFAGSAFMWSDLNDIIQLDRKDRDSVEFGVMAGLREGITVPYVRLGECMGSCTFAGSLGPAQASRYLGPAQMIGTFAFQAALRLIGSSSQPSRAGPKLHPRPRDCVLLAGRGLSNKQIARALSLTPRTVDGYLTEARRLFDAHDRTELVISAVLAGEVGLHELRHRQPEYSLGL